ncbi:MAG: hypothetical protein J6B10_07895 [Lachnospiraceae bacterium]|nr:hypothetical protein [Lachnospiraceae bacterium]
MTVVWIIVAHISICAVVGIGMYCGKIKTGSLFLPTVIMVPLWGLVLLGMEESEKRRHAHARKDIGVDLLKIQDVKYERISFDENKHGNMTVPLEEAIAVNDAKVSRQLMKDILYQDPGEFIDLLKAAGAAEDIELVHYATTAMMEIQSRYELEIHQLFEKMEREPENLRVLQKSRRVLQEYIDSGLVSGSVLNIYRERLDAVLTKLCQKEPDSRRNWVQWMENRVAMQRYDGLEEKFDWLQKKWPEEEQVYQAMVGYYWQIGDGVRIQEILDLIKRRGIYLTVKGQNWYRFWSRKEFVS